MKIVGIAQRGTESGLTRIRDLVASDEIEFLYLKDFKKADWDTRMAAEEPFDGVLSQCITHVPYEYRQRTILFGLGSTNRKILNKKSMRSIMKEQPLKEYWVNNNTVSKALSEIDIKTRVMYRANDVYVPKQPPPRAANKFILWYASPWNGCLQKHKVLAQQVISKLGEFGVKIFMFPHDKGWVFEPHVIALGKVDLKQILPIVHGMVRFGELGDFGRVNYDIVGQGRWTLNYGVDEPWMESVNVESTVDEITSQIMNLIEKDPAENRHDRWLYAKRNFTPEAMRKKWTESLYYSFYG